MPPVVRRWPDGQTAIAHCWQRFGRLTMCCYLVKGNITLLLFMQNAILKYKGLPIIVIVVLHFNVRTVLVGHAPEAGHVRPVWLYHILRYIF